MTSADLMRFERQRRYATLVALAVEGTATITDEVIGLHDRIVGKLFNTAKHKHQEQFQADGKRSTRSSGFMEELGKRCWRPGRMAGYGLDSAQAFIRVVGSRCGDQMLSTVFEDRRTNGQPQIQHTSVLYRPFPDWTPLSATNLVLHRPEPVNRSHE